MWLINLEQPQESALGRQASWNNTIFSIRQTIAWYNTVILHNVTEDDIVTNILVSRIEQVLSCISLSLGTLTFHPPTNRPRNIPTHTIHPPNILSTVTIYVLLWYFDPLTFYYCDRWTQWQFITVTLWTFNILLLWQMNPVTIYYCDTLTL
jgi:hypothetical protein